jgi:hypothetical protein
LAWTHVESVPRDQRTLVPSSLGFQVPRIQPAQESSRQGSALSRCLGTQAASSQATHAPRLPETKAQHAPRSMETYALSRTWPAGHQVAKLSARARNQAALWSLPPGNPFPLTTKGPRRLGSWIRWRVHRLATNAERSRCCQAINSPWRLGKRSAHVTVSPVCRSNQAINLTSGPSCSSNHARQVNWRDNRRWQMGISPAPYPSGLHRSLGRRISACKGALCLTDEETPSQHPSAKRCPFPRQEVPPRNQGSLVMVPPRWRGNYGMLGKRNIALWRIKVTWIRLSKISSPKSEHRLAASGASSNRGRVGSENSLVGPRTFRCAGGVGCALVRAAHDRLCRL